MLVRGSRPRRVRIAEEHRDVSVDLELGPLRHLSSLIPGERPAHPIGQIADGLEVPDRHTPSIRTHARPTAEPLSKDTPANYQCLCPLPDMRNSSAQ